MDRFQIDRTRLRFERRFAVLCPGEAVRQRAVGYWSRRGMVFREAGEALLTGSRGSVWGNLISFDPSELMAEVTITFDDSAGVRCVLVVDRSFQIVTDWNRAWWELELETFESFLVSRDEQPHRWQVFKEAHRRAAWDWALSVGMRGRKISPADRR